LPGALFIIGLIALVPSSINLSVGQVLIPALAIAFISGHALHALGLILQGALARVNSYKSHREYFASECQDPDNLDEEFVNEFKNSLDEYTDKYTIISDENNANDDGQSGSSTNKTDNTDFKRLYPLVQSYIYADGRGRSRSFQAIYALSFNMIVLSWVLIIMYIIHIFLWGCGIIFDSDPLYIKYFGNYYEFIIIAVVTAVISSIIFCYHERKFKKIFAQYVMADFLTIKKSSSGQDS
jgi:branched-subunit amino acid transport protein